MKIIFLRHFQLQKFTIHLKNELCVKNWYKIAQNEALERLRSRLDYGDSDPWLEDDYETAVDSYYDEQFKEYRRNLQSLEAPYRFPKGEGENRDLIPLKNNPPNTRLKNNETIEKEALEISQHAINLTKYPELKNIVKKHQIANATQEIQYLTKKYNKFMQRYEKFLLIRPKHSLDQQNKEIKQKQYQSKINDTLNQLNYQKAVLRIFENIQDAP